MSGAQTVQMQQPQENMATSIEHLSKKSDSNEMVNNIMDSYQDMEIQENEDDNPEDFIKSFIKDDIKSYYKSKELDKNYIQESMTLALKRSIKVQYMKKPLLKLEINILN